MSAGWGGVSPTATDIFVPARVDEATWRGDEPNGGNTDRAPALGSAGAGRALLSPGGDRPAASIRSGGEGIPRSVLTRYADELLGPIGGNGTRRSIGKRQW